MGEYMFNIGDYVTRNSYNNDIVFKIIGIENDIYYLKGMCVRLYADSYKDDLVLYDNYDELVSKQKEFVLSQQLLRSGTSIGANIKEAQFAQSKADFIAKMYIALKESGETEYWLELLIESGYYSDKTILDRCVEIKRILISSINTAKNGK